MMNLLKNKRVALVGGGPGGLTLALLLKSQGANVTVYERDRNREARDQGATLDLHEDSGLKALKKAGLLTDFYRHYRPDAGKLRILDPSIQIKMDGHNDSPYEEHRPEIDRGPLRQILLDHLDPECILWDHHFSTMEPHDSGWKLYFKNGTTAQADLVIGSDGEQSKVRPYLTPIRTEYSGLTLIDGSINNAEKNIPFWNDLVAGGKIFALGDEQSIILSSKENGDLSFYIACKIDEVRVSKSEIDFTNPATALNWFKKTFSTWDKRWWQLFESATVSLRPRPQYHYPLNQSWETQANLTLIGDAAHVMPPYAGEGVNMALQDALVLSEQLCNPSFPDLRSALQAYEKEMLIRSSAVTKITLESMDLLHSDNAIKNLIQIFNS